MKNSCFKINRESDFYVEVQKQLKLRHIWSEVMFQHASEILGEKITKMAFDTKELAVDLSEIKNPETKKLFKQDGTLKKNLKKSKEILKRYQAAVELEGLSEYEELRYINFRFGVMRVRGQSLESFRAHDGDIYYKANFDLNKRSNGNVVPISEIEYEEMYLETLKKQAEEMGETTKGSVQQGGR